MVWLLYSEGDNSLYIVKMHSIEIFKGVNKSSQWEYMDQQSSPIIQG